MTTTVDIRGLDKVLLLRVLWNGQATASFYRSLIVPAPVFDHATAREAISRGYIDYFCGRAIKMDLRDDDIDPSAYEQSAGAGTAARFVAAARAGQSVSVGPDRFYCANEGTQEFEPFGESMFPGQPNAVMCAHCGKLKKHHGSRK